MDGIGFGCDVDLHEKVIAIQIAANQLWKATSVLLENADTYNIDTSKVFAAGYSAGAETILHAAYWDREQMKIFDHHLAPDFKYAGIISGAGAIMDLNLITSENVIPLMAFHGNKDIYVPYATAAHHYCPCNSKGWLMFFGSHSIANHMKELGGTFKLITFDGGGHGEGAGYIFEDQQHVVEFINNILNAGEFNEFVTIRSEDKG